MPTLSLNDIVNITVNVSSSTVANSNFNVGLILGNSSKISQNDRVKVFSGLSDMIDAGFVTTDPEYLAAQLYFGQSPSPSSVVVGRQVLPETLTVALDACRKASNDWYGVLVCGATKAQIIEADNYIETASPACVQFYTTRDNDILTKTVGNIFDTLKSTKAHRSIGQYSTYGTAVAGYEQGANSASTDISAGTNTTFKIAADGDAAPKIITLTLVGLNTGLLIAQAMQEAIQALGGAYSNVTVDFITANAYYKITSGTKGTSSSIVITAGDTNDLTTDLKLSVAHGATDVQGSGAYYDSAAAIMGYAMGANTRLNNSAYTLAYKPEVGITTENLDTTQVKNIKDQNGNIYLNRGINYNLFEQGVLADGTPFDELINLDLLKNDIQIAIMNALSNTIIPKIPQTEDGVNLLIDAITVPCSTAKNRGFIAPGVWNAPALFNLNTGDTLANGFVIMADSINNQSQVDRDNRIAPPIYVAIKLAGAIEHVVININVNK